MTKEFSCIYCKKSSPNAKPSKAHIFPDAFGIHYVYLLDAVCDKCNFHTSKELEEHIIKGTAPLRNLLGVQGRRGKSPVSGKAIFMDLKTTVSYTNPKELDDKFFVFKGLHNGKKKIAFIGDVLSTKKYEEKHPEAVWETIDKKAIEDGVTIELSLDFGVFFTQRACRLAAKIAYEYFCYFKGRDAVDGREFDDIRNYILNGSPQVAFLSLDPIINAGGIPFGLHAIYLDQRMGSSDIIALVNLFGLISYKMYLTKNGLILGSFQDMTSFSHQRDEPYKPVIRTTVRSIDFHGRKQYDIPNHPKKDLDKMAELMLKRMNDGFSGILERSKHRAVPGNEGTN